MSGFDREAPTKRVKMVPDRPAYPNVPGPNGGFSRKDTSSIIVDSEAIVEERDARPPAPPRTSAQGKSSEVPKAGILRVPKPRISRD